MGIKYNPPYILPPDYVHQWTPDEMRELLRCADDVVYFAENYYTIIDADPNSEQTEKIIELYDYQKEALANFQNNRFVIMLCPRQSGKSTVSCIYLLWFALFKDNKEVGVLANNLAMAMELMGDIQKAYELLPPFLKHGVKEYNKTTTAFSNGSVIFAKATSPTALRGRSCSLVFMDEFAFIPENMAEEFWRSNYPVLAKTNGNMIIVSTPKGTGGLYYNLWMDAENRKNQFYPLRVRWDEVPGRDEKWKEDQISNIGELAWMQEFECFWGKTLINVMRPPLRGIFPTPVEKLYEKDEVGDYLFEHPLTVQTPHGFVPFTGVRKLPKKEIFEVTLENGYSVKCSKNHRFVVAGKEINFADVSVGDDLETDSGKSKIISIEPHSTDYVYDLLQVENEDHSFYGDGILHHNCSFEGSAQTLIKSHVLTELKENQKMPTEFFEGDYYYGWDRPKPGHIYLIGADISQGTGQDYSVLQIFDVTDYHKNRKIKQVAIWRRNTVRLEDFCEIAYQIALSWNKAAIIAEDNGLGTGDVLVKTFKYEYDYEFTFIDMERKKVGINANSKTKPEALKYYKSDIETGKMEVLDETTIHEMFMFEEIRPNVYQARKGRAFFDDCVSPCYWVSYCLRSKWWELWWEYMLEEAQKELQSDLDEKGNIIVDLTKNPETEEEQEVYNEFLTALRMHDVDDDMDNFERELMEENW